MLTSNINVNFGLNNEWAPGAKAWVKMSEIYLVGPGQQYVRKEVVVQIMVQKFLKKNRKKNCEGRYLDYMK